MLQIKMELMRNNAKIKEFAVDVVNDFCDDITDKLFLHIQGDEKLMDRYASLVSEVGKEVVNQDLGLLFKEILNLENKDICKDPKSELIESYTRHCLPKNTENK